MDSTVNAGMSPTTKKWLRLGGLIAVLAALAIAAVASGVTDGLTVESFRAWFESAGVWGGALYVAAFSVGLLMQLPGTLFIASSGLAYGKVLGPVVALLGALAAVMLTFFVVRGVGGKLLTEIEKPFMKKLLARLDARPILTIAALRTVFWVSPILNYALSLSSVKRRDYFIGSVLGLVLPVTVICLFVDAFV